MIYFTLIKIVWTENCLFKIYRQFSVKKYWEASSREIHYRTCCRIPPLSQTRIFNGAGLLYISCLAVAMLCHPPVWFRRRSGAQLGFWFGMGKCDCRCIAVYFWGISLYCAHLQRTVYGQIGVRHFIDCGRVVCAGLLYRCLYSHFYSAHVRISHVRMGLV